MHINSLLHFKAIEELIPNFQYPGKGITLLPPKHFRLVLSQDLQNDGSLKSLSVLNEPTGHSKQLKPFLSKYSPIEHLSKLRMACILEVVESFFQNYNFTFL